MRRALLCAVVVSGFFVGCTKDKGPAAASVTAAAVPVAAAPIAAAPIAASPAAPTGVPNAAQMARLQQQALAQAGAAQQKTAVNWRLLMPTLSDDLAGWKADGEAKGETTAIGAMSISKVERNYTKDGKPAHVEIVDTAVMPALASSFNMMRMASSDGSDRYARGFEVGGNPGWEEWSKGGSAKATVLISGRFLVAANASGLPDAKPMIELVGKIDAARLAALNK